jgi:metal-dependent amidase/aminoacylase/carboxypeptidase family protein
MSKRLIAAGLALAGLFAAPMALAQEGAALTVSFQGPGGHSNGNYGRTSAVHAAARAITRMAETMDASSYAVSGFEGGNSVNSIASDARFTVQLKGDATAGRAALTAAVDAGVKAENDFRGVKPGDETGGVPAAISYTITP